ncbi:MAG TPA: hypothetical protein VJN64_05340 [Terriglobales bacterium]|nr:hypothetical protein [Terriglobales bacterium]
MVFRRISPLSRIALTLLLVCLTTPVLAQSSSDSDAKPSSPADRQRFLNVTRKLEQDPLDESMRQDRGWALKWLEDVPDINVSICPTVLGELPQSQYRYVRQIAAQFSLEMGAFLIEHPQQVGDLNAQYLAGVEGALRAYKSILKTQPMATSAVLEGLLNMQEQGKLEAWVRERARACEGGDQVT